MAEPQVETGQATVTEYAIVVDVGHGLIVLYGPTLHAEWNETMSLTEAAEKWYPGGVVVSRTVTTFDPVVTDWQRVLPPGEPT